MALLPERKKQLRSRLTLNFSARNANNIIFVCGAYSAIFMPQGVTQHSYQWIVDAKAVSG